MCHTSQQIINPWSNTTYHFFPSLDCHITLASLMRKEWHHSRVATVSEKTEKFLAKVTFNCKAYLASTIPGYLKIKRKSLEGYTRFSMEKNHVSWACSWTYLIPEWGAERVRQACKKQRKKGRRDEQWQQRPEQRRRGDKKERKINSQALPVIFLFGDRINILLS